MNDDELKTLWQQQPLREPPLTSAQLVSAMQRKTTLLRRCLDARDLRELAACAVVMLIFGFYAFYERTPIVRLGWIIVIGSAFFAALKLIHTRRSTPPAPPGETTVASLRAELNSVRAQSRLLASVLWWYLLPPGIGLLVATWGMPIDLHAKIPATLFYLALYAFIYWLNQWARSKQLLPLEAQLESLLHSAESGEPLDEAHVAHLRPIAILLAAADRVKPVEFRVAFWQIALWGEIGFIGIWFFLMLGLTVGNDGGRTNGKPTTNAQSIPPAEAKRYLGIARSVIDLLNARDYAGIRKRFNTQMSEALPPQKASEFFTDLTARFGGIEAVDGPTGNGYRGWIAFRLHCQHSDLIMSLALDTDDNISGIYFEPQPRTSENVGSFLRRPFGPLHLALIMPFFLAGLLYSWLIQKSTERAVGISTLGIHLQGGQDLILWDEINEVRPFRFLHIRNLWLIKESGEKTRMHWTPLERHSELRAAVEGFAPADHPIRKHLSLLRNVKGVRNR